MNNIHTQWPWSMTSILPQCHSRSISISRQKWFLVGNVHEMLAKCCDISGLLFISQKNTFQFTIANKFAYLSHVSFVCCFPTKFDQWQHLFSLEISLEFHKWFSSLPIFGSMINYLFIHWFGEKIRQNWRYWTDCIAMQYILFNFFLLFYKITIILCTIFIARY